MSFTDHDLGNDGGKGTADVSSLTSRVEQCAVDRIGLHPRYESEYIKTIVVDNFPALGKLTAMRFIEWVQANPGGVVSLPTGKTPEHFIKWVTRILNEWDSDFIQNELKGAQVDSSSKPDMFSLYFVQMDEFFPIDSSQANSFYSYIQRFYIKGFGLDPEKALLMDCESICASSLGASRKLRDVFPDYAVDLSLRHRASRSHLETQQQKIIAAVDQWCTDREGHIRSLGGIGFWLGGIGPDGHIAFNCRGADQHSTTRLCATNYETQAAAATDLGGIEVARHRLVITIGLGTITYNKDCVAVVMAAGEAKAAIVNSALTTPKSITYPATALQGLLGARFYITLGAMKLCQDRVLHQFQQKDHATVDDIDKVIFDLAVKNNTRFVDLTACDVEGDHMCTELFRKLGRPATDITSVAGEVCDRMVAKIDKGLTTLKDTTFLHTEPHHDDIMLGYLPAVVSHTRVASNQHYFCCLTSGFNSVTNGHMESRLAGLEVLLNSPRFEELSKSNYFDSNDDFAQRDVWQYLDGVAANDQEMMDDGAARRLCRNLVEVFGDMPTREHIQNRVNYLRGYFANQYDGQRDTKDIQTLKGTCREWEAECLWGYIGWSRSHIRHLRLGFYTADIFSEEPEHARDVSPVISLIKQVNPDVVGVTIDPEASGPDTHYKVLQAITAAIKTCSEEKSVKDNVKIWGYRNVWFRFQPHEINMMVPVSLPGFGLLRNSFMNTFASQKEASFPSYEHDGPFCDMAQKVQVMQYQRIKTCLGREWFHNHPSPHIRATRGFAYVKEMDLEEFKQQSLELRARVENR